MRIAIAAWEKGASRVIDCKAIGGSGGWKRIAQGWAGEKEPQRQGHANPSQVAASSINPLSVKLTTFEGSLHDGRTSGASFKRRNEQAWREHHNK